MPIYLQFHHCGMQESRPGQHYGFFADARNPFIRRLFAGTYVADLTVPAAKIEKHLFSELLKKREGSKAEEKKGENYAADAKAYMDMYYGEGLQIKDVADALHIHPNYLSACFKKVYHQTPREYLNNLRMERACLLLGKTEYSIAVIAGTS